MKFIIIPIAYFFLAFLNLFFTFWVATDGGSTDIERILLILQELLYWGSWFWWFLIKPILVMVKKEKNNGTYVSFQLLIPVVLRMVMFFFLAYFSLGLTAVIGIGILLTTHYSAYKRVKKES